MNKSELITTLARSANITEAEASLYVETFFHEMRKALVDGKRVEIRGFGSFKIKEYASYTGRNPKTGEIVTVAPKRLPFFRPGRDLKNLINDA
ncbi:MAG: integration host factor subunit beta [Desulfovibrio sp.]|nr:integration host factor subunit beta [Desulfovibrio sp.]